MYGEVLALLWVKRLVVECYSENLRSIFTHHGVLVCQFETIAPFCTKRVSPTSEWDVLDVNA